MHRFHVHVSVENLDRSIVFYTALFGVPATLTKPDYAKWQLEDPRVNFAISSQRGNAPGINHLGIQAGNPEELEALYKRLGEANISQATETCAKCCYSESDKHWATDPTGITWETFHTMGSIAIYGNDTARNLKFVQSDNVVDDRPQD